MSELQDANCIVKAFQSNNISIIRDDSNKYLFRASDVANVLEVTNIRRTVQNYTDKERVCQKCNTLGGLQDVVFLTSHGVYRLLYSTNKKVAEQFREWVGDILDDLIFNQGNELKKRLEERELQLKAKDAIIQELENKPDTEGFSRNSGYVYLIKDTSKVGHYKIGYASDVNKRLMELNVASSTYTLEVTQRFETYDKEFAEKIIHRALLPFRIQNRKEWFYIRTDFDLAYVIHTIKDCIKYIEKYNITDYSHLKDNYKDLNIQEQFKDLDVENKLKQQMNSELTQRLKQNAQNFKNKTGNYKGAFFTIEKQKWRSELKMDNVSHFLGYFDDEISAGKAYNDYATFLNQDNEVNYSLNDIPDYVPTARDIPYENKELQMENKTSQYLGVSYDSQRKYYVAGIKYKSKTYSLGNNKFELECAKSYNQQAAYFNSIYDDAKYILNDIPGYTTVPKNVYEELQAKKLTPSSKYTGVSFNKQSKKYKAYLVYNKKQITIGQFSSEVDAVLAYNKKAKELNDTKQTQYKINELQEDDSRN